MQSLAGTEGIAATATTEVRKALSPGEIAFNYFIFGLSTCATAAFAWYLITNPSMLNQAWKWIRALPIIVQLVLWLLALPWMFALWVWSTPWALAVRIVLVVGTLLFAEYLVFPWKP